MSTPELEADNRHYIGATSHLGRLLDQLSEAVVDAVATAERQGFDPKVAVPDVAEYVRSRVDSAVEAVARLWEVGE